uniref:Si:dkeyp-55f12.3 n=1 Tax=Esox lucius TaxID=8010 RepID=A0AAY5K1T6_ESOLU
MNVASQKVQSTGQCCHAVSTMAANVGVLRGELKYRDGLTKEIVITTENNLTSMIVGIKKLNADVSRLLTDSIVQENLYKGDLQVDDGEEEDVSEDDDDEEDTKTKVPIKEPPAKRSKTLRA